MIQGKDGIEKGEIGWFITNKIDRQQLIEEQRKREIEKAKEKAKEFLKEKEDKIK